MKYFNTKRQKLRLFLFQIFLLLFFGNTLQMKLGIAAVKSEELKESNSISWTNIGPYGGHINCMAISLSNPDIIFAGTPTGLFKTVDRCANWTETGFSEKEVNKVQVDPYNTDVIYLGTNDASDGIFKSEDGGETWAEMGLTDHSITALAIDPNSSNVLYTGTRYRYQVGQYEWEAEVTIFKSTDGGETWEKKISWITDGECGWDYVEYILVDPDDSYCIYAGGENNDNCPEFGGFLKSTDGGGTWINRSLTFETEELVTALAKPANSQVIYALCEENDDYNLYKTTDKGDNWIKVECPYSLAEGVLAVDLVYPERVYAGSNDGEMPLLVYKDDEDKWYSGGEGLPPQTPSSVVIDPQDSDTLYLGFSDGGVYKSTDWAVNWNEANQGLNNVTINALAVHPTSSEKVFAAGSGFGYSMAKTANHGTSWDHLINAPSNIENISLSHQDPPIILVGKGYQGITGIPSTVYFSIYKSTDDGQNWTKINFAYCSGDYCALRLADILIDENNSDYILLGTTSVWQGAQPFIARTTDGGINWDGWLDTSYITGASALAVDPNNPGVVYSADKYYGGLDGCVYRHTDVWGAWNTERIKTGIEGFVRDIEVDMNSNLYVATWKGLLKWDGSVWKKLTGLPTDSIYALEIDRIASPETLYVAPGGNGVYVSQDGGSTWIPFNEGLANLNITKLALSETQPGILYAGTKYGGVWSINVSPFNKYKLTIAAGSGGTTDPAPGTYTHDEGAEVTITASPESGYEFSGWSGDASGTTNPITIIMDSDKTITANFILIPQYSLTIAAEEGGTTDPAPGSYTYDIGTGVNIEAIPNNGYEFSHWSGDVAVGHETDNPITISMDADKSVTAHFIRQYTLTINANTGGTTNPSQGSYMHDSGASVSVTAIADSGYSFSVWSGDVPSGHENDNPLTLTMDSDKSITASFIEKPPPVPDDDDQGPGCFIATAAYGSPLHPHIDTLRQFRDKYLMTNKLGRKFVAMYYKYSPFVAERIAKYKILKVVVRIQLLPLVALSYSDVNLGPIMTAFVFVLIFTLPILLILYSRRKIRGTKA